MINSLEKIDHFILHKGLIPYIGEKYDAYKILLIGESHYFPKTTYKKRNLSDFAKWYEESDVEFTDEEEKSYYNTRQIVNSFIDYNRSKAHNIFRNPANEFVKLYNQYYGVEITDSEALKYFAFYNYFQRPELLKGASFAGELKDYERAKEITDSIREIIKPQITIFLSMKAYNAYSNNLIIPNTVFGVDHPDCPWWFRKKKNGNIARETFFHILEEKIFNKSNV